VAVHSYDDSTINIDVAITITTAKTPSDILAQESIRVDEIKKLKAMSSPCTTYGRQNVTH